MHFHKFLVVCTEYNVGLFALSVFQSQCVVLNSEHTLSITLQ